MTFQSDIAFFQAKVLQKTRTVHKEASHELRRSVVRGSSLTGAPGQPVQSGNLAGSWNLSFPEVLLSELLTNVVYAPAIENAVGPKGDLTLRSSVGGFHSVKLTRAGFPAILTYVMGKFG